MTKPAVPDTAAPRAQADTARSADPGAQAGPGAQADPGVQADPGARRRGRRPAGEDTRGLILAAARSEFAGRGYDGTTIRGIARAAGVDARLVHHYFDGKEDVFVTALGFPARPQDILPGLLAGPPEQLGERLALAVLGVWDSPGGRDRIMALLSGAIASEAAARMLREFVSRELLTRIADSLQADRPELRAALAASHLVGLAMVRVLIKVEPVASLDVPELARVVGPVLQHYLTDPQI